MRYAGTIGGKKNVIEIVTPDAYGVYERELNQMFKLRHQIFKDRLRWSVPSDGRLERDEFDDLNPTYVLALDDDTVVGCWRMLPTTGPTMIRDVFPELLEGKSLPSSKHVWESSRFTVACQRTQGRSLATINRLTLEIVCGLTEYCLTEGIYEVLKVYDLPIGRLLVRIGCPPRWQSGVHRIGDTRAVLGWFDATHSLLNSVRRSMGISGSVIQPGPWLERVNSNNHIGVAIDG